MSNRRSRKSTRTRKADVKKPELRKPQVLPDGTPKPRRRPKPDPWSQAGAPALRVRPDGRGGLVSLAVGGWLIVAAMVVGGLAAGRWFSFGYPDSLWLYIAFGAFVAMPAVAYVARTIADVNFWVLQGGAVSLAALVIEGLLGPSCATGADCAVIGARGALGPVGAVFVVVLFAALARVAGMAIFDWTSPRRRPAGRISHSIALVGMLVVFLAASLPVGATLLGTDLMVRQTPTYAKRAIDRVDGFCFSDFERHYELVARPAPESIATYWSVFAVRRSSESRPTATGKKQPSSWLRRSTVDPYEAIVAFDSTGELSFLECRKVSPKAGNADAHDIEAPTYGADSPIKPQDILQAPSSTPTTTPKKKPAGKKDGGSAKGDAKGSKGGSR